MLLVRARPWSLTSLREKLVKIGAKVVRHARYDIFQMAEVAVPKELFEQIPRLIDGLQPRRLRHRAAAVGCIITTGGVRLNDRGKGPNHWIKGCFGHQTQRRRREYCTIRP
jgi:hypothetical protein